MALGSVNGTLQVAIDELRAGGVPAGALDICSFRPFPLAAVRAALADATRVIVIDCNLAVGQGGVLASNVRMALRGEIKPVYTAIAGLGGRPITRASLTRLVVDARRDALEDVHFLDLDWGVVDRQLAREHERRRSGPAAESILRDMQGKVRP